MFGLGFFATLKLVEYIAVICMILVSINALMAIFGWSTFFGIVGKTKKGFRTVEGGGRKGEVHWSVD